MKEKLSRAKKNTDTSVHQENSVFSPQYVIALLFVVFIAIIVCVIFWQKNTILEEKIKIADSQIASSEVVAFEPQIASQEIPTAQETMEEFKSKHDKISETDVEQYWEISSLKEQNAILVNNVQALKQYNDRLESESTAFGSRISELESEIAALRRRLYNLEAQEDYTSYEASAE